MQGIHSICTDDHLLIEKAVSRFNTERGRENVIVILEAILYRIERTFFHSSEAIQ